MAEKSKILIIGGTGSIGKFIVDASAKAGHPTFALVRESTASNPDKLKLIESFKSSGVTLVYGDVYDHGCLVKAIKQVDVVISAIGSRQIVDQVKIIAAIKEAGNVKRFFPSEFGLDADRVLAVHTVEPGATLFRHKCSIRRAVETEGIPYTYISSNGFAGHFLASLGQANATVPPRDKVVILGDGNTKGICVKEEDIAAYTIKAVDDPRTLNKILYIRPPANVLSINEIVSIWEKKIGKTLEKIYIPEDQINDTPEAPIRLNMVMLVKGYATNFEIEASFGVEASELYPEVKYTTVDEYFDQFV